MGALVGGVNGMVMSRVVGNGKGVMQEVGGVMGVMDGFSPGRALFEENGGMSGRSRRRGVSISSAEGNSVFGGSMRNGSRSGSWSRSASASRSRSRSGTRSRSLSVEIIENPHARQKRSPPTVAGTNPNANAVLRATIPDEVAQTRSPMTS